MLVTDVNTWGLTQIFATSKKRWAGTLIVSKNFSDHGNDSQLRRKQLLEGICSQSLVLYVCEQWQTQYDCSQLNLLVHKIKGTDGNLYWIDWFGDLYSDQAAYATAARRHLLLGLFCLSQFIKVMIIWNIRPPTTDTETVPVLRLLKIRSQFRDTDDTTCVFGPCPSRATGLILLFIICDTYFPTV